MNAKRQYLDTTAKKEVMLQVSGAFSAKAKSFS